MDTETLVGVQYVGAAARPMVPLGDGRSVIFERDGDAVGCPEDFVAQLEDEARDDFVVTGDEYARAWFEHPPEPERGAQVLSDYDQDDVVAAPEKPLTIAELKVIAEAHNIDLAGARKRDEIQKVIDAALSTQGTPPDPESANGDTTNAGTGE